MADQPAKRACSKLNKKGEPCQSRPLVDSDPPVCFSHSESSKSKDFFGKGHKPIPGAGRPRKPTVAEVVREMFFENPGQFLNPLVDARDNAVLVFSNPKEGVVKTEEPDHAIRTRAANDLLSWGFAKPKDNLELTVEPGVDGGVRVVLAFDPKPEEASDGAA